MNDGIGQPALAFNSAIADLAVCKAGHWNSRSLQKNDVKI